MATHSASTPLLTNFELDDAEDYNHRPPRPTPTDRRTFLLLIFACFVSVLSILLNFLHFSAASAPRGQSPLKLVYPNPYIGLDSAVLPSGLPPAKPILNWPLLIAQVNRSDPHTVYLQNPKWDSSFGMIYDEQREFEVSTDVSTILQFRTLDFGMTRCVLTLEIPSAANADANDLPRKNVLIAPQSVMLTVNTLATDASLPPETLSWATASRLHRIKRLTSFGIASLAAREGVVLQSAPFVCAERSLLTVEVTLDGKDGQVKFTQDHKLPRLGFYLMQHPAES
ncbi:hypothetical protein MIND_01313900 [Mycena indigotica]|uniref:Ubiquitin 3 binding protein But2 C-terminal domain-containing protein n=1 Tax=Mycena indigotica TaxID=2126181 RepID=A0A8H6VQW7_9AGAR|nr:uncharacterized protein MIND_01313900 [Mycena indigotica]KAF7290732.1 hypothetical protein MIND_01313900 [Mycena indigotica]